jgi:DNA-binding ferritin-like protein (Dps family)
MRYYKGMDNQTTIMTTTINKEMMAKMAELAADSVRERIMDEFGDLIHDAVGDAVLEVLGEDFVNELVEDSEEAYFDIMMDVTSRIAIVAV